MNFLHKRLFVVLVVLVLSTGFGLSFIFMSNYEDIRSSLEDFIIYNKADFLSDLAQKTSSSKDLPSPLANPPLVIKSVYVTGWSAGVNRYLNYLSELFKTTQINAVVIDVKDVSGFVTYKSSAEKVKEYKTYQREIPDINKLITFFHDQGIYVIGRVAVFKDSALPRARPDLAVYDASLTQDASNPVLWQDKSKLNWLDPASQEVQDYNISIAKEALSHGFDEINFDYIRFPSDGKTSTMGFPFWDKKTPRHVIIKDFFKKIRDALPHAKISVDLFGQTTISKDDMGIGQVIEDSFEYFDYVSPMVYPSHYVNGFMGFHNPAEHPYEIIKYSIETAMSRKQLYLNSKTPSAETATDDLSNKIPEKKLAKIRPWLQDFNLGAMYDAPMVKQEIQAVEDSMGSDFNGFLLWNPSNFYTKDAITLTSFELK